MDKILITKAEIIDAQSVVDIFNLARAKMTYLPTIHTSAETKNFFTSLVKNGNIWIAKVEDSPVGFMEVKYGWLHHLYILPDFQNKGIGKLLLDKAKSISPTELSLWVFEENTGAIRFYEKEGFVLQEKRSEEQTTNEENLPDRLYKWK